MNLEDFTDKNLKLLQYFECFEILLLCNNRSLFFYLKCRGYRTFDMIPQVSFKSTLIHVDVSFSIENNFPVEGLLQVNFCRLISGTQCMITFPEIIANLSK